MRVLKIVVLGLAIVILVAVVIFGILAWIHKKEVAKIEEAIMAPPDERLFDPGMVQDLHEPARRYFLHAIRPGTPLYRSVVLAQKGLMKMQPDRPHIELQCTERLTPGKGFVWQAGAKMGPIPISVTDYYYNNEGSVRVALVGLVPVANQKGPDIARSARGRLAAESLWCPTALLPRDGVRWEAVDDDRARVVQLVDGEEVAIIFTVDDVGRLNEIILERYGNEGREDWGFTPYGFRILEERTFEGITIPSRLRGGWWYGSDRYKMDNASEFEILKASFR